MAGASRRRIHRGTFALANPARDARAAGAAEHVLFLPRFQAVVWRAAASLSHSAAHRAGEGPAGRTEALRNRGRIDAGLQRDELLHGDFPQDHRTDPEQLLAQPRLIAPNPRWNLR